tara:strand:- start:6085 stop:6312 length:228 start_codon:yes stop_codon:yes gene_type:complete
MQLSSHNIQFNKLPTISLKGRFDLFYIGALNYKSTKIDKFPSINMELIRKKFSLRCLRKKLLLNAIASEKMRHKL